MCGKFTAMMTWGEYCALASVGSDGGGGGDAPMPDDTRLGTFTPMSTVPVLHLGPVRQRRLTAMRWGWYDPAAPNPLRSFKHLHARSETIDTTHAWAESFQERRGVVFTKQFNIGEALPNGKTKQWCCNRPDNKPVAIAVLFNQWETIQGPVRAFAMATTASCPPLNAKDDRMPALLANDEEIAMWIGELGASDAELKALLRPYEGELVMREQDGPKPKGDKPPPKPKKPKSTPQPGLF